MKRKLDNHDVPREVNDSANDQSTSSFDGMGLDPRLLQAITREKFGSPTSVQSAVIPVALEGKDVLGKTFKICLLLSKS